MVIKAAKAGRQLSIPDEEEIHLPEMEESPRCVGEALDLTFIPSYYRANCGGNGQMRVQVRQRT